MLNLYIGVIYLSIRGDVCFSLRCIMQRFSCRCSDGVSYPRKGSSVLGPSTWALAAGKNDMMTILISKLIDDGVSLYKVSVSAAIGFTRLRLYAFSFAEVSIQRCSVSLLVCLEEIPLGNGSLKYRSIRFQFSLDEVQLFD